MKKSEPYKQRMKELSDAKIIHLLREATGKNGALGMAPSEDECFALEAEIEADHEALETHERVAREIIRMAVHPNALPPDSDDQIYLIDSAETYIAVVSIPRRSITERNISRQSKAIELEIHLLSNGEIRVSASNKRISWDVISFALETMPDDDIIDRATYMVALSKNEMENDL